MDHGHLQVPKDSVRAGNVQQTLKIKARETKQSSNILVTAEQLD